MPPWEKTGVPGDVGLTHFRSSTISGSASWMIWRTFASVFPRQSPSSLILSSINAEADSTGIRLFMCSSKLAAILAVELLQGEASSGRHLVGAILSKKVAERHGLSTSII